MPARLPFSFELFPPRDAAAGGALDESLARLVAAGPSFVSVTYGANGSTRDGSLALLRQLRAADARPMAHLTCVGLTVRAASVLVRDVLDAGITRFLALRGDPPVDGEVVGDLGSASELVQLIHRVEAERAPYGEIPCGGRSIVADRPRDVEVAVAAFPNGHPGSGPGAARHDVDALLAKQAAGATLAITQLFFDPYDYERFVELARARGVTIPIVPGIIIPDSARRLVRAAELAHERPPTTLLAALEAATPRDAQRIGVDATVALVDELRDLAPSVHLYTFNRHRAALEVLRGIGSIAGASA